LTTLAKFLAPIIGEVVVRLFKLYFSDPWWKAQFDHAILRAKEDLNEKDALATSSDIQRLVRKPSDD